MAKAVTMGTRETWLDGVLVSVETIPDPAPNPVISAEQFLLRFTVPEMVGIDESLDDSVTVLRLRLQARETIDLQSTELANCLSLLVAKGLLTEQRKSEIITP
jgi:hypothetical protein